MKADVYNQRYETFRHLDKLRWQMLQLLVAVASATAFVLRTTSGVIEWWFFFLLGSALILLAWVMIRIGDGIRNNAIALKVAAEAIGDNDMPDVSNEWKSVALWIALLVLVLGGFLIGSAIFLSGVFSGG